VHSNAYSQNCFFFLPVCSVTSDLIATSKFNTMDVRTPDCKMLTEALDANDPFRVTWRHQSHGHASWNKQMMVDYLIHLKLTWLHLQIVFCIARQVKQLEILIFLAAILKNMFLEKCSTLTSWHTSDLKSAPWNWPESIENIIYVEKQGSTITPISRRLSVWLSMAIYKDGYALW